MKRRNPRPRLVALSVIVLLAAAGGLWLLRGSGIIPPGETRAVAAQSGAPVTTYRVVASQRHAASDFQAGASVLIYANDPAFKAKARRLLDHLADLHVNSLAFVFPIYQDEVGGNLVYASPVTPTMDNMRSFFREAHQRKFTVLLRPLLDIRSSVPGHWRGTIKPGEPSTWLASYRQLLLGYAQLAQEQKVEALDIGSELDSMEPATGFWRELIASIRAIYPGQLTYSSNWGNPFPAFESGLDFASIDAYYPLDVPGNASVDQLRAAWPKWVSEIQRLGATSGKPIVLTELGVKSQDGSYRQPWALDTTTAVNLDHQKNYYAAACGALKSTVHGIYWWTFDLEPPPKPTLDSGFSPSGKPAELEITRCYA
jgi:hypothetical protein